MEIELTDEDFDLAESMIKTVSKVLTPMQGFDAFRYLLLEMTIEVNKAHNIFEDLDVMVKAQADIDPDPETYKSCQAMVRMMNNVVTPYKGIGILAFIVDMMLNDFNREPETIH